MKRLLLALVMAALLLMAGCRVELSTGTVYNKLFIPAHTEYQTETKYHRQYVYDSELKGYTYKDIDYQAPVAVAVPDDFRLYITGYSKDDKQHRVYIKVSKALYEQAKLGDWFDYKTMTVTTPSGN
jgi:hypothetical protein